MRAEPVQFVTSPAAPLTAPRATPFEAPEAPAPTRSFRRPDADERLVMRLLSDELHEHLETVAGRSLQARLDQQQGAYKRSTFMKRRLMMDMKKANHKFTPMLRDYRSAVADLLACQGTSEHARSLNRLVIAGQALAEMAQHLLAQMGAMREFDGDVQRAGELVRKEELLGRSFDEIRATSNDSELELGHWESEWSHQSVRDGLDCLNGGLDVAMKDMALPAAADSRVAVATLVGQQARLRELLGKLG